MPDWENLDYPVWEGLDALVKAGFTDRQIRRIIFVRRYHREHPEERAHCHGLHGPATCHAAEALAQVDAAIKEEADGA